LPRTPLKAVSPVEEPLPLRRSRLALALLFPLVLLVVAEGIARWRGIRPFAPTYPRGSHQADEALGLRPTPGFRGTQILDGHAIPIRINRQGLRGAEIGPKRSGTLRLAVLGDSFVFGHGVREEDTMTAALQARFDAVTPGRAEVLNAGVMSYGTAQAARFLRDVVGPLEPDFALLVFFSGNDAFENLMDPLTVRDGHPTYAGLTTFQRWIRPWKLALKFHLAAYRWLAETIHEPEVPQRCSIHPAFGLELCRREESLRVTRAWDRTRTALEAFRDASLAVGARPAVAVLPTRFQVYPSWWRRHREDCPLDDPRDWDRMRSTNRAVHLAREVGLRTLHLHPYLLRVAGDEPLYFCDRLLEMHLTPRGHAEVARILFEGFRGLFGGQVEPGAGGD